MSALNSKNKSLFFMTTDPKINEKDNKPTESGSLRCISYPFFNTDKSHSNIFDI